MNDEVRTMKWITAAEIDNWTVKEPRRAQEVLPQLIWKLILGSCTRINDHHFPYVNLRDIKLPGTGNRCGSPWLLPGVLCDLLLR